jgi:hypothetical protein
MVASLVLAAVFISKPLVIASASSPSRKFAVAWGIPGVAIDANTDLSGDDMDRVENYLVNRSGSVLCKLNGPQYYKRKNFGRLAASYAPNESYAAIIEDAKWEPRSIEIVDTARPYYQIDVWPMVRNAMGQFAASHRGPFTRAESPGLVYEIDGAKLTSNRMVDLDFSASVPKDESDRALYLRVHLRVLDNSTTTSGTAPVSVQTNDRKKKLNAVRAMVSLLSHEPEQNLKWTD